MIGDWQLNIGGKAAYPCLSPYSLITSSPLTSNLIACKGSVLTQMPQADAGAVRSSAGQNLHPRPWERGSKKGSKNIEIYLVRRTAKAGRKISGQTGVAMFTSATYVWTFIWRCLNEMWQQHQIQP